MATLFNTRMELKRLAACCPYVVCGGYLIVLTWVRMANWLWPRSSMAWTLLFGAACQVCSLLLAASLVGLLPGRTRWVILLKIVGGAVLIPVLVVVFIYLPYVIPYPSADSGLKGVVVWGSVGVVGVAILAYGIARFIKSSNRV